MLQNLARHKTFHLQWIHGHYIILGNKDVYETATCWFLSKYKILRPLKSPLISTFLSLCLRSCKGWIQTNVEWQVKKQHNHNNSFQPLKGPNFQIQTFVFDSRTGLIVYTGVSSSFQNGRFIQMHQVWLKDWKLKVHHFRV